MIARPLLDHARLFAKHGLRVFPCARLIKVGGPLQCACWQGGECDNPGKHPLQKGWRDIATTESTTIFTWWGLGGADNIGIATGIESGIVVLDIDPRHGGDQSLASLERQYEELLPTWRFLTGGGGEHILFRHPGGYIANDTRGYLGVGIDIRGDGGLIVAPPSLHISGRTYAINVDCHPDDVPLAPLPEWLFERLTVAQKRKQQFEKPVRASNGLSRYGETALDNACRRIVNAADGEQEQTLNREGYSIGRLAGAGAVPTDFALRVLKYAAGKISSYDASRPWHDAELDRKVERAFAQGARNPRRVR